MLTLAGTWLNKGMLRRLVAIVICGLLAACATARKPIQGQAPLVALPPAPPPGEPSQGGSEADTAQDHEEQDQAQVTEHSVHAVEGSGELEGDGLGSPVHADLHLDYYGSAEDLQRTLSQVGLQLEKDADKWRLVAR